MTEELLEASASDFEDDELEWDEGSSPDDYIDESESDKGLGEDWWIEGPEWGEFERA